MMSGRRIISTIFLSSVLILSVTAKHGVSDSDILGGYAPGVSGMQPIDKKNCLNDELLDDHHLSNALECARTCHAGEKPKTCYYKLVVERYEISGRACTLCTPNITNAICANCQCILGDGMQRSALVVNRMLPGPSIQVCLGDRVVIDVYNKMQGEAVSIHWHGIFQKDSQYYDGVPHVTQCPIHFGDMFRYQFKAGNGGTHFYHAHTGLHKMDGVLGTFIIRVPAVYEPNAKLYKFDLANHVMVINDWMDESATERWPGRIAGVTGQLPDSLLINGRGRHTFPNGTATNISLDVITVEANKRYRFRMINAFCTTCSGQLTIEGHTLTVIETDGQPVEPVPVNSIVSSAGERYDFVINTNQTPGAYWIQLRALGPCLNRKIQQLAILQYINATTQPKTPEPTFDDGLAAGIVLNPASGNCNERQDDAICISHLRRAAPDKEVLFKRKPDLKLYLPVGFRPYNLSDLFRPNTYQNFFVPGGPAIAAVVDGISYEFPPSPPLSQYYDLPKDTFCNSKNLPRDCRNSNETCKCTHVIDVPYGGVLEIFLIDESNIPGLQHPFHQHGYAFRVLTMGQPKGPTNVSSLITVDDIIQLDKNNQIPRNFDRPPGKDTLTIPDNGYAVLRILANNPGYWLLHCHFIYHQLAGMELILRVGSQRDLPPVPKGFPKCGNFKPKIRHRCRNKNYKETEQLLPDTLGPISSLEELDPSADDKM